LVRYWLKKIRKYADENAEIIILGNKIDLINEMQVDDEVAEELA